MISLQGGASLAKQLFPVVGPIGATSLRLSFASILLCLVFRPWRLRLNKKEILFLFFYGASLGCMNFLFYSALMKIPLGITVALEFIGPLGVALIASRRAKHFFLAALAALGIVLLLPLKASSEPLSWIGISYALGAGLCWALYIVFGQKVSASVQSGMAAAGGMCVAALVVLPLCLLQSENPFQATAILPLAVAVAVLSSALPYSLEMVALKKLSAHTFGLLMSLEPVIAALIGLVFLREHLTLIQWFAIFCIITASIGKTFFDKEFARKTIPPV
jgi:inner membrane transporter RhtA